MLIFILEYELGRLLAMAGQQVAWREFRHQRNGVQASDGSRIRFSDQIP